MNTTKCTNEYNVYCVDFFVDPFAIVEHVLLFYRHQQLAFHGMKRTEKEIFNMHFAFRLLLRLGNVIE